MKIRVVDSKPRKDESDINRLIGEVFEVKEKNKQGVMISFGETGLFLIRNEEFEVIEEDHIDEMSSR
ncbi:hypothetical protein JOD82_001827 [Paenibacillus sp. 1182]|uniref:hypothetical protein n=1 Tax=Paenibacillus sp. 1182 TaxID=2806565 RepID=UPI001AE96D5B|nr:hypothetical protein [Paenibacillus sp. 1182]MBP1308807.1 hypothetical protein [Paenibacillus sp. 1182]